MGTTQTSLKGLVEFIAKSLVDDPYQVHVSEFEGRNTVSLELRVGPEDMGRVIGKNGRTVNAMRTLLRVPAARQGKRVSLEIM